MNSVTRRLLGSTASTMDRAFVAAIEMRNRKARARADLLSHDKRIELLGAVQSLYGAPELITQPELFFPPPPPAQPEERYVRALPELGTRGEVVDVSWPSAFTPFDPHAGERYLAHVPNRTAHARILGAKGSGRPAIIVVHGYMGGHLGVEERMWSANHLLRWGLDVALFVLPFHGIRATPGGGAPPFPGGDPRRTNEGFRQVVGDLRSLMGILRARGASKVGIMGMSLGGYSTSLMATLEPSLAFAVPVIPLASVADFARKQGRLGSGADADAQHVALERANLVVSPLARPCVVPRERVVIVAAEDDQVTPIAQAERLASHFDVPLLRVAGGHLLQTWRPTAFRAVRAMLRRVGVL
jgi:pimeloyl-ACP methyl ester carboxylesterase